MRYKITKQEFDKLSDDFKAEYKSSGDGYVLEVDGLDTKAADKFAAERDKRRAAEKRADDAEKKVEDLEDKFSDTSKAIGDAQKAQKKAEDERDASNKVHAQYVRTTLLDNEATTIAGELSKTAPKLLLPHVKDMLDVDMTDPAEPKLVYKDKEGKVGAKRDDVLKNLRDNKDFSAIITASQASGGTPSRRDTNGHGPTGPLGRNPPQRSSARHEGGPVDVNNLSASEMVARVNARFASRGEETV